jgi:ABC-type multidrug transport system fused ATPase/permease subunit
MRSNMFFILIKKLKDRLTLLNVDFSASWMDIIVAQKFYLIPAVIGEIIYSIFRPLIILLFGFVFASGRLDYFIYLFICWFGVYVISFISRLCNSVIQLQTMHSMYYRAHQWFLQVDPMHHSRRSSGTILAKIDRASRSYEELMEALSLDMIQMIMGVTTVLITLFFHSVWLGIISTFFLAIILLINIIVPFYFVIPYEKRFIRADDKVKSIGAENLSQVNLIRTCFASDYMKERLKNRNYKALRKEGNLWFFYNFFYNFVRFLYLISVSVVAWYVLTSIKSGIIESATGMALLSSYLRGTHEFIRIEKPIRHIVRSITRINDLFSYISSFGKQTFPVLQQVDPSHKINLPIKFKNIFIEIKDLFFDYDSLKKIFEGHNFCFNVTEEETNKLYGVIGPSGIGKSTFFSILGGQIKPELGFIFINDIGIYHVDAGVRRKIISLQGQVAAGVRGTLRYNLLFGLPKNVSLIKGPRLKQIIENEEMKEKKLVFSDNNLIEILKQMGMWNLFESKEGLDTFVGEGGYTLSGGQRQRLNFANLYLRSLYYEPAVILIDEPTSSLDEISEKAITDMIMSLAKKAATFVIAHRIKTLANAAGIIDFSLLTKEKSIKIYSHKELRKRSVYYKKLIAGIEPLES